MLTSRTAPAVAGTPTGATSAQATYYSEGMPKRSFNVKTVGINDQWAKHFDTGRKNWNDAGVKAKIGRKAGAKASFTANRSSASWYGVHTPSGTRARRAFKIQVNARTIDRDSGSKYDQWVRSATTRELGHAPSLHDNPNTSKASLMKHSRNRATVRKPPAYDKSEVKRIYS
ncbi:hypothetical protein [Streptomyces sp. NPDC059092]|uniref:hypothetical protein n=1 Tax=Streptomyces sp. NPDC059092 TaxID=3346725 RepID=UPI0036AF1161